LKLFAKIVALKSELHLASSSKKIVEDSRGLALESLTDRK